MIPRLLTLNTYLCLSISGHWSFFWGCGSGGFHVYLIHATNEKNHRWPIYYLLHIFSSTEWAKCGIICDSDHRKSLKRNFFLSFFSSHLKSSYCCFQFLQTAYWIMNTQNRLHIYIMIHGCSTDEIIKTLKKTSY